MARIRIGDNPDPMDSMFTSSHTVDLTRGNAKKNTKASSLNEIVDPTAAPKEEIPSVEDAAKAPKKKTVSPVNVAMNADSVESFDPSTIIPKKEKRDEGVDEIFGDLDKAIAREKDEITKRHQELYEAMYEEHQDIESGVYEREDYKPSSRDEEVTKASEDDHDFYADSEFEEEETVAEEPKRRVVFSEEDFEKEEEKEEKADEAPKPITIKKTAEDIPSYDDEEFESDMKEEEEAPKKKTPEEQEAEMNQFIEDLKVAAKKSIKPSMKTVDLSKFTISDKGVKASKVILEKEKEQDVGDWVLYDSGHPISMSGLTGPELIKLDPENSTRNRYNTIKDIYKIIYNHVVDSKKPSFENWMKQTKYTDLDHIYFALYMATFGGSNFISYQCPDCKNVFIKDVKFDDMITYKDDTVKAKVKEILSQSTDVGTVEYDVELVQASDEYAFGMKAPSLYNVVMETAGLPENILEKYADLIDTITYIDSVYMIDYTNNSLIPVNIPVVKDDPVKTTIKRIQTLYDILKKLNSDEYYRLRGYISKLNDASADITYMIPEAKCPECDTKIEANKEVDASTLLFTRHHLGAFASM